MRNRLALLTLAACLGGTAQQADVLYDEAKVPAFTLPEVLALRSGERVSDSKAWTLRRRPEILAIYEAEVFGKAPAKPSTLKYEVKFPGKGVLGGKADRKIVTIFFGPPDGPKMDLLLYLPADAKKPVAVFLGMNFSGIQTVANDPGVPLGSVWVRGVKAPAPESSRGTTAPRWQVEKILAAGYGLAVFDYNEVEPDAVGAMAQGIRQIFLKPGQTEPGSGAWGAIGAWGWAASRAMDYLEKDRDVDSRHVALFGHSRLGKTALWAGALDTRFSIVIANESGEGGAAIARRTYGERTKDLNVRFPHWFDGNFKRYSAKEEEMPFESPMLMSLIAPRGLYVASAEEDRWSDPKGEFLGAAYASAAWDLFGRKGISTIEMPGLHHPVGDHVRYHIRAGKHDVTAYDWEQYLKFAAAEWAK